MLLSRDRIASAAHGAPSTMLRMVPLPRVARGRLRLRQLASPVATGEVARRRRDDRGASDSCCSLVIESHLPPMAPPPAHDVRHLPRCGRGGFCFTVIAAMQYSVANPSGASGREGTFCPLRISIVQAKRVWNPQVLGNHERNDAVQIGADFLSYQGDKPEA